MYQRYYRQRKLGRFFSFFLVVTSGTQYYIKQAIKTMIEKPKKTEKYEEYIPKSIYETIDTLNKIKMKLPIDSAQYDNIELKFRFYKYYTNLERTKIEEKKESREKKIEYLYYYRKIMKSL